MLRNQSELVGLNRSSLSNQLSAIGDSVAKPAPLYNMDGLVEENKLTWFLKNVCSVCQAKYTPYPVYTGDNTGIFKIEKPSSEPVTIALLSDWASYTAESQLVAKQTGINDYSIHLGDTYYVGNDKEIAENFNTDQGGTWPYGTLGSFAMIGNHEMYSSGKSYFTQLLPYMGAYVPDQEKPVQVQQASFFTLENEYWRIVGLDTGYNSLTGLLGLTPNTDLDLTAEQKTWLQNTVRLSDDNRGIIILSHHQCFSAFESEFPKPAAYIASLLPAGRDIIWLWGHEHYFSVYGPNKMSNGGNLFARCIGNSGMPVELYTTDGGVKRPRNNDPASGENRNLVLYDSRKRQVLNGNIPLGYNGYLIMTLQANNMTITYFDDNNLAETSRKILEEKWTIDNTTGALTGTSINDFTINGDQPAELQLSLFGGYLSDAITKEPHP